MEFVRLLLKVLTWVVIVLGTYELLTRKYKNPYKLIMYFGKKGAGKSTTLVKETLKHLKRGWKVVYCTERIPGTYYVKPSELGRYEFEENSLLLIDEVGMIFDNRDYKNFPVHVRDWFKLQRHRKVKVIMFSQAYDVDKKLRDLMDHLYILTCNFRVFTYGRRIVRKLIVTEAKGDEPSTLADQLKIDSFLWFLFGSRSFTYIPKYIPYFNSYDSPKLKKKEFEYCPIPDKLQRKRNSKRYIITQIRQLAIKIMNRILRRRKANES